MTRRGIDVASYQHPLGAPIDWNAVRASGIDWCAVKLTESNTYTNPYGAADIAAAKAAGLETLAYHFARPTATPPEVQARYFLEALFHAGGADAAVLDLEDGSQLGWPALGRWANGYLFAGAAQVIYWDQDYRSHLRGLVNLSTTREWVAAPGAAVAPAGASIWQTGKAAIPGIRAATDVDVVLYDRPGGHQSAPGAVSQPAKSIPAPGAILHRGDRGDAVRRLQEALNAHQVHVAVDGIFGDATRAAVIAFQRSRRLLADGWVGPATWAALAK